MYVHTYLKSNYQKLYNGEISQISNANKVVVLYLEVLKYLAIITLFSSHVKGMNSPANSTAWSPSKLNKIPSEAHGRLAGEQRMRDIFGPDESLTIAHNC